MTEDLSRLSAEDLGRVHVIGIGGVGMLGVARLLLTRGIPVSGSDIKEWPALETLRALGATIQLGQTAGNVHGVDTVVYSTAIPADNVELVEARRLGLRVLHRAEALVTAMNGRQVIAIAGTNGKTTTTSMVTTVLQHCGVDPSFFIGGEFADAGVGAHHGSGQHFVVEADESDRSFLLYSPFVAILTNLEADHLNTYGDMAGLEAAFREFVDRVHPKGFVVVCADDAGAVRLGDYARSTGRQVFSYGRSEEADLRLTEEAGDVAGTSYVARLAGEKLGAVSVPVPGGYLALNSAAALLAAVKLDLDPGKAVESLGQFRGVRRRFELKGVAAGVRVYDEYAYHPTSMTGALTTLRTLAGTGRLIVAFQPYRMYRTVAFQDEIAQSLALADDVVVMEVFGPGEVREPGQGGAPLARAVPLPAENVVFEPSWSAVAAEVVSRARPGDLVVTMGAPPISMLGTEILAALEEQPVGRHAR
ncbi:UDP-N-acetylmuramate--L-alanine ligase [Cryptosporangium arvum]|uniref:UDP-N-acetylmuramate--L-alanine ligase n=1 Tax=Cryptosporangium arvum TaxID=80871 RepID=UPI0004B7E975|nr:UDP-N-acetylmuramate--L-alanine ligase [Cryptosporangium arvum]